MFEIVRWEYEYHGHSSHAKPVTDAGLRQQFPWGQKFDSDNLNVNSKINGTIAVGCFYHGRSIYGCEEIAGNVYEWCQDWYSDSSEFRIIRGWDWNTSYKDSLSDRGWMTPESFSNTIGFRLVVSANNNA